MATAGEAPPLLLPRPPPSHRVATVRSLKRSHGALKTPADRCTGRLSQKIVDTHRWLAQHVDPVFGDCITFLLVHQPQNVAAAMREYLQLMKDGRKPPLPQATGRKVNRDDRIYMARMLSPVLERLMNMVLSARPSDVLGFMIEALVGMEGGDGNDAAQHAAQASSHRPPTPPQRQHGQQSQQQDQQADARPRTARRLEDAKQLASQIGAAAAPRKVQLLLIGASSSGKTSFLNALQGRKAVSRPTMGFKPVRMSLDDQFHITFYDLGGGPKIRDIWSNYFHDVHGVLYFVDSSDGLDPQTWQEHVKLFQATVSHPYLRGKPLAVVCSNQTSSAAREMSNIASDLGIALQSGGDKDDKDSASDCTRMFRCCAPFHSCGEAEAQQQQLDEVVRWMMGQIDDRYGSLEDRVKHDTWHKDQENLRKERERERRLFKEKLASIFLHSSTEDCFDANDGIEFLASEVGVAVADLPPEALTAAQAVGYHKLLLQMVGAMRVPISKRRQAVDWLGILELLDDVRREAGLEPCQRIEA